MQTPEPRTARAWELLARRALDVTVASIGLAVLAPIMLGVAVAIRATSKGPALFRQERLGTGGRPFTLYKFRTMRPGASDAALRELIAKELRGEDTAVEGSTKLHADPQVTAIGSWLRRTSLDELPQLINVLRGEMSLVGPRPCLPWEGEMFPDEYHVRFDVPPGITGLWQVCGRSRLGTLEMLQLDVAYANGWGFWRNVQILLRTVPSLLEGDGAR